MHTIEPFYRWENFYRSEEDEQSVFFDSEKTITHYENTIYGYYIHPMWEFFGSETLYLRVLYVHYEKGYAVLEFIGEWNDTLHNDIALLKRNVIDHFLRKGIDKFILIAENVLNFHGSDDCYYEEWFQEVEQGWIAGVNFQEHVTEEMAAYNVDWYINFKGDLDIQNWRTLKPLLFCERIDSLISRRLTC